MWCFEKSNRSPAYPLLNKRRVTCATLTCSSAREEKETARQAASPTRCDSSPVDLWSGQGPTHPALDATSKQSTRSLRVGGPRHYRDGIIKPGSSPQLVLHIESHQSKVRLEPCVYFHQDRELDPKLSRRRRWVRHGLSSPTSTPSPGKCHDESFFLLDKLSL
jgi:hypothetical protein